MTTKPIYKKWPKFTLVLNAGKENESREEVLSWDWNVIQTVKRGRRGTIIDKRSYDAYILGEHNYIEAED